MERPIKIDEIQGMWTYLASIDWYDPWFRYLLLFHVVCCAVTILIRRRTGFQFVWFGFLLLLVFFAENINEWAALNYKLFSKQQYFDSNGLFISTIFSTPILINCLIMVVFWLLDMSRLMMDVRHVKHSRNTQQNKTEPSTTDHKTKKQKGD